MKLFLGLRLAGHRDYAQTMILVVLAGSLMGMSLPFLLSCLKLDPSTASAPLVATTVDAVGVVLYVSIATALLT